MQVGLYEFAIAFYLQVWSHKWLCLRISARTFSMPQFAFVTSRAPRARSLAPSCRADLLGTRVRPGGEAASRRPFPPPLATGTGNLFLWGIWGAADIVIAADAADAAAPPRCRRPRSGLFVCAHAQVAFRAAFACFLDSDARVWCVGRVLWMARAVGSVVGVFACVSVDRFWVDGDFMLCRMHASGVVLLAEYQFHTTKPLRTLVWTLHICTSVPARPRPPTNMCQNAPAPVPTPTRAHDSPRTLTVYTLCTSFVQARGTQPYSLT